MRKLRLEYQGAFYHVIARGNHRQKVFLEAGDFVRYLKYLGETLRERDFKLYAYCLMGNHVHLFLEQCSQWPLSRVMHRHQTAYTYFFNERHHKSGHLFQGRYKSILVDSDAYLLQLVRYIHLNPWRAKLEEKLGKYQWTSHRQYAKREKDSLAPVEADAVLRMFSKLKAVARKRYQKYMLEGQGDGNRDDLYELRDGRILGSEDFEQEVHGESGSGLQATLKIGGTIGEFWEALLKRENLELEPIGWRRSRLVGETAYWMVEFGGKKQTEIADHFKVHFAAVHEALKRYRTTLQRDPKLRLAKEFWVRSL